MSGILRQDFARVASVIRSIETTQYAAWDTAETPEKLYFYQLRAAHNVDIFEPYTAEQAALNAYLSRRNAGRRLCDYAWRLYAQSLG